jgi:RimJ/RimL family protein N-acetyltransferase
MSYWVLPDARGAGVAARATRALTRWVFDTRLAPNKHSRLPMC